MGSGRRARRDLTRLQALDRLSALLRWQVEAVTLFLGQVAASVALQACALCARVRGRTGARRRRLRATPARGSAVGSPATRRGACAPTRRGARAPTRRGARAPTRRSARSSAGRGSRGSARRSASRSARRSASRSARAGAASPFARIVVRPTATGNEDPGAERQECRGFLDCSFTHDPPRCERFRELVARVAEMGAVFFGYRDRAAFSSFTSVRSKASAKA
jgi:hypothetical protein